MQALARLACVPFLGLLIGCGTPWEAQVGGLVYITMNVFVRGEFADGQPPANQVHRITRRICAAEDFLRLSSQIVTRERFLEFDRECETIDVSYKNRTVTGTAFLPAGHCETIQREFLKMLRDQVYSYASDAHDIVINYKGATIRTSRRGLARSLTIAASCNSDASFSVTARR